MTCPGDAECTCTWSRQWQALEGEHAYRWGLAEPGWWRTAIEREFEGAGRVEIVILPDQLVTGRIVFGDGWMWLPLMASAVEPRAYGRDWRERAMNIRMERDGKDGVHLQGTGDLSLRAR